MGSVSCSFTNFSLKIMMTDLIIYIPICLSRVIPGARRNHRGPRTGGIAKNSSKKQLIREVETHFHSVAPIAHPPLRLPTQRFQHTLNARGESILDWVSFFSKLAIAYLLISSQPIPGKPNATQASIYEQGGSDGSCTSALKSCGSPTCSGTKLSFTFCSSFADSGF